MLIILLNILLLTSNPGVQESEIKSLLNDQLPGYEKINFEFVSDWSKYQEVKIVYDSDIDLTGNIVHIPVKYTQNGKIRNTKLAVRVKCFKKVLVSKSNVKRGELILQDMFTEKLVDCITLNQPISSLNDFQNFRSASYLKEGEVLVVNSIEPLPAVRSGDRLIAHSIAGNVDIQLSAVARQEGNIDEIIRVKTPDNKLYNARILDNSNVLIIE